MCLGVNLDRKPGPALCVHVRPSCPRAAARARPPAVREAIHSLQYHRAPCPPLPALVSTLNQPALSRLPAPRSPHGAPGAASLARPWMSSVCLSSRCASSCMSGRRVCPLDGITANKQHSDFTPCGHSLQSPESSWGGGGGGPTTPQGSAPLAGARPGLPTTLTRLRKNSPYWGPARVTNHLTHRLAPAATPSLTPPARSGPSALTPPRALHPLPKGPAQRLPCAPLL